jgi:hypothetical protein
MILSLPQLVEWELALAGTMDDPKPGVGQFSSRLPPFDASRLAPFGDPNSFYNNSRRSLQRHLPLNLEAESLNSIIYLKAEPKAFR